MNRILRYLRKYLFIPLNTLIIIITFFVRKFILGFPNAILYFSRVDKSAVISILRLNGATIGYNCDIETGLVFHNCTDFTNLRIGNNCHIGKGCFFDLKDSVTIEDNCVISMKSVFITHLDLNRSDLKSIYQATHKPIILKSNTYISTNVTILQGVVINENCIVAANALVRSDVPARTLVGGIPSKVIKQI